MKGWILYDDKGAKRNAWFIEKLKKELADVGLQSSLKIIEKGAELPDEKLPDFAIVRTINPALNQALQEKKVRVFNNALTAKVACDKWETYLFCKANNIPVLPTKLVESEPPFPFPFVVKSRDGHGGDEVFLIKDTAAWEEKKKTIDSHFIAQPLCDEVGKDMRVYALGETVLAEMLRTSKEDFRSNFSLGGSAQKAEIDDRQKEVVKKLHALLGYDFVGIDFIRHKGEWILNEIEDAVGTRMLYKHTDIDAVHDYALHVKTSL